jgi:hypothetical protein
VGRKYSPIEAHSVFDDIDVVPPAPNVSTFHMGLGFRV